MKDRPALSMIRRAQERGDIKPGDTLIEPTSGNTGIALAMCAAMMGYRMILVMPEHLSIERRQTMAAFGAEIVLTPKEGGMEMARDVAEKMRDEGRGVILDQFANPDNPLVALRRHRPRDLARHRRPHHAFRLQHGHDRHDHGRVAVPQGAESGAIQIVGCQPTEGSQIPGIRKWPPAYLPKICDWTRVDRVIEVSQADAEEMTRRLAREEGIFAGISSGGALWAALQVVAERRECRDRVHHLRPRRPLSVHRRFPGLMRS